MEFPLSHPTTAPDQRARFLARLRPVAKLCLFSQYIVQVMPQMSQIVLYDKL